MNELSQNQVETNFENTNRQNTTLEGGHFLQQVNDQTLNS